MTQIFRVQGKSSCENEQILDLEKFPLCEAVRLSSM